MIVLVNIYWVSCFEKMPSIIVIFLMKRWRTSRNKTPSSKMFKKRKIFVIQLIILERS